VKQIRKLSLIDIRMMFSGLFEAFSRRIVPTFRQTGIAGL